MNIYKIISIVTVFTVILFAQSNTIFASPAGDNIIISEIEYDSTASEPGAEWFELYNPTPSSIDISGWEVTDGEGVLTFPASTIINSGSYFLGVHTLATFNGVYPAVTGDIEYGPLDIGSITFANGGDELTLSNGGTIIDFVSWENHTATWNIVANAGESISRLNSIDTDLVADWDDHVNVPTPGTGILSVINTAPTDIKLDGGDSDNFDENTTGGSVISVLTSVDVDITDVHTYSFVAGVGDEDNNKFQISGANLQSVFGIPLIFTPDFENPIDIGDVAGNNTYSIRIETNDGNGGVYSENFIITVNDIDENISSRKKKSSSLRWTCNNEKALNYNRFGRHKESLCKYGLNNKTALNNNISCHVDYYRIIKKGITGNDVRQVQHCMNQLGFTTGPEDGIYGSLTYAGITEYQISMKLRWIDGIVGPETSRELNK